MVDYVCKYAPVEIIAGFAGEARLCDPLPTDFTAADQLTHRNICSYARALIEIRLAGGDSPLLLTDCCDSLRNVHDVLCAEGQQVFFLTLPHSQEHCGKLIYKSELLRFIESYTVYTQKNFDIKLFRAAFPAEAESAAAPYISLLGAKISNEQLAFVRRISPLPIQNDTCTGMRQLGTPPVSDDLDTLIEWYADRLLTQLPCMRMTDITARKVLTNDPCLQGVIYNTVNFCDFYSFEYAQLKRNLPVPLLKLETDYSTDASGQMKTRLEAFFENLPVPSQQEQVSPVSAAVAKLTADQPRSALHRQRYTAGIDSGSTSTNAVILDDQSNIISFAVVPTGVRVADSARAALNEALQRQGLSQAAIYHTVTTGYGRAKIDFREKDITEITCHAKGAYFLNPAVRTVIDMGGQDSKVIRLDERGNVKSFVMNDKCAAGTGRFIEMMAQSLGLTLEQISTYGLNWEEEITISSMCSVFAQSEVVSLIADDKKLPDIVHGLNQSVAAKIIALTGRAACESKFMMTGGVAKNIGVVQALEARLKQPLFIPEEPEICGALGAALLAATL